MDNITLERVTHPEGQGAEAELTVRGCKVTALFSAEPNTQVYHQIKRLLMDACTVLDLTENTQKIGQNTQNVR